MVYTNYMEKIRKLLENIKEAWNKWNTMFKDRKIQYCKNINLPNSKAIKSVEHRSRFNTFGLPWWCSGWESACQCRRHGLEPWSGKIPHAAEQLGPWAHLELVLRNKRGRDSERPAHLDEEWPPLATTRESPRTEMKTQHSQKLIN